MTRSFDPRTHLRIRANRSNTKRSQLLAISTVIQNRDIKICLNLFEHKVLTTHQINDLFFNSYSRTRSRLLRLHRAGIVDRFTPYVERGSAPNHYMLGDLGAHLVAGELGMEVREIIRGLNKLSSQTRSQRLQHMVEVNGFFARLAWGCRQTTDHFLTEWWSEKKTHRSWGEIVSPDGFGQLQGPGQSRTFFLELDRGTESPSRLAMKLAGYEEASLARDRPDLLLFCFPDQSREVAVRKVLHPSGIPIATTTIERHRFDPLGQIWLPLGNGHRARLLEVFHE